MSYLPFVAIKKEDGIKMDFVQAAQEIMSNKKLYDTFHAFMDIPEDVDFLANDVVVFLRNIYDLRNTKDKLRFLDIFTYQESTNSFKLKRNYFDIILNTFFKNMKNYDIKITLADSNSRRLTFKSIFSDFKVSLLEGDGSNLVKNNGSEYENNFFNDVESILNGETPDAGTNAAEILSVIVHNDNLIGVSKTGNEDVKRFGKEFLEKIINNDILDVKDCGSQIADITLELDDHSKEYLSLKAPNGTRLANIGISSKVKLSDDILTDDTIDFFNKFKFNANTFKDKLENTYISKEIRTYKPEKDDKSNIFEIEENEYNEFKKFISSFLQYCLGYKYWYVKEKENKPIKIDGEFSTVFYNYLIENIKNIVIEYPKETNKCGIVRVRMADKDINKENYDIKIIFKNSQAALYPNRISVEYSNLYEVLLSLTKRDEDAQTDFTFDDDVLFGF